MQTQNKYNIEIEKLKGELLMLSSEQEKKIDNVLDVATSSVEALQNEVKTNTQNIENKANANLSNVTYPQLIADGQVHINSGYTTYMSTDSNTWYILYPTGKKECGVSFKDSTDGDTTVTLPISFNSTSFVCTFSGGTNDVYAMIRIEKLDKNKVRVRFAKSFNTVNPYPSYGCLKCEGI